MSKMKEKKETGNQKKMKGMLIGEVKKLRNPDLADIISKIQSGSIEEDDFDRLESVGIDTSRFKESFNATNQEISLEQRKEEAKRQKVKKYIKDEEFKKSVVIQEIVGEVNKELLQEEAREKTKRTIRNKLEKSIEEKRKSETKKEELTEEEKLHVRQEAQNGVTNIESILIKTSKGKQLTQDESSALEQLIDEYNVDVQDTYNEIMQDKETLINDVQRKEFDKIRASITVGIEKAEEIGRMISSIRAEEDQIDENDKTAYDYLVCSNKWYIGIGKNVEPEIYIREDARIEDRSNLKKEVRRIVAEPKNSEISESLISKYKLVTEGKEEIQMADIETITEIVTGPEKLEEVKRIKAQIQQEQRRENENENDREGIGV